MRSVAAVLVAVGIHVVVPLMGEVYRGEEETGTDSVKAVHGRRVLIIVAKA